MLCLGGGRLAGQGRAAVGVENNRQKKHKKVKNLFFLLFFFSSELHFLSQLIFPTFLVPVVISFFCWPFSRPVDRRCP